MYIIVLAARLLLSILFFIAAVSKLLGGLAHSRKSLTEFGIPTWLVDSISIALPGVELSIACMLILTTSAWFGAISAVALLLAFDAVIAANLVAGKSPECNCFGQLHSKPIGWSTFARNSTLAALAYGLAWQVKLHPSESIWRVVQGLTTEQITVIIVVIIATALFGVGGFLLLQLFQQNGRLLLRIETLEANRVLAQQPAAALTIPRGLPIGSPAVQFDLPNVRGGRATLDGFLRQAKPLLLLFSSPNCGPCNALMPDVAGWQKTLATELSVLVISDGRHELNRAKAIEFDLINVLIEKKRKVAEKYSAFGTPTAVLVRQDGKIGSYSVGGAEAIRQLVAMRAWTEIGLAAFLKAPIQTPPAPMKPVLPVGSAAPTFKLPDIEGTTIGLAELSGQATVLLFWNPACGFCQKMLDQLKEWEYGKRSNAPRLVLVSSGSVEANRQMKLQSTVLLDEKFSVGQVYGAGGTPSALLIAANGKIASGITAGAPGVLEMLGGLTPTQNTLPVALAATG